MEHSSSDDSLPAIHPPAEVPDIQRGDWFDVPADEPVVAYLTANLWEGKATPDVWQAARLSHAVYAYREQSSGWTVAAKFYAVKVDADAHRYAIQERRVTEQARSVGGSTPHLRAVQPLAVWRGVLFLEYVAGLTLEDVVAVRRHRPGTTADCLVRAAELLAALHVHGRRAGVAPDFAPAVAYTHEVVHELQQFGVLQRNPVVSDGLSRLIDRWADDPRMHAFTPTYVHGDATISNFIVLQEGDLVAIDWERFAVADPAADLGRLLAEVSHSVTQHGGSVAEAVSFVDRVVAAYREVLPAAWDGNALVHRARFYRAQSTLRIARNGWIARHDRMGLVAQAAVLLAN